MMKNDKIKEQLTNIKLAVEIIDLIIYDGSTPPPNPPEPSPTPDLPFVTVRDKTPLMEVGGYDGRNKPAAERKPVLRLYKYGTLKTGRIRAKPNKNLYYVGKVKTAQGIAFILSPLQEVDGFSLTIGTRTPPQAIPGTRNPKRYEKRFHILKSKVTV